MSQISITEALVKLKTLGKRIERAISVLTSVAVVTGKNSPRGFNSVAEFDEKSRADFKSAQDLIKYRQSVKSAIVAANAMTTVTIGNKTMTVAQAIERKNSIQYEKDLLSKLSQNYSAALKQSVTLESDVQAKLQKLLEVNFGKDSKAKAEEFDNVSKPFLEANMPKIVDPLDSKKLIDDLEKDITEFEGEVDFRLSEANARTMIEVSE